MSVPVILLTGFLGSGKTTLLNAMLADGSSGSGKLAVIVNEFGTVGVDGDLLPADMSRQIELPGGCVCCLLDDDLGDAMIELIGNDPSISLIIVETTGIAEPIPISWTLAKAPLNQHVRLASIVTTVDAANHRAHRPLSQSVDAQVTDADILVLTKRDLVSSDLFEALHSELREQNNHAPILTGNTTELAHQLRSIVADPKITTFSKPPQTAPTPTHQHMESKSISIPTTLDFEELTECLEGLPKSILRVKGIADGIDVSAGWKTPVRAAFHRVGARVSIEALNPGQGGEPRLVAVGYQLDATALKECIRQATLN